MSDVLEGVDSNVSNRIHGLVAEVLKGEHEVARLLNSSYDFSNEMQAMYFANTRKNLQSDMGHVIMEHHQQLDDIKWIKEYRTHGA